MSVRTLKSLLISQRSKSRQMPNSCNASCYTCWEMRRSHDIRQNQAGIQEERSPYLSVHRYRQRSGYPCRKANGDLQAFYWNQGSDWWRRTGITHLLPNRFEDERHTVHRPRIQKRQPLYSGIAGVTWHIHCLPQTSAHPCIVCGRSHPVNFIPSSPLLSSKNTYRKNTIYFLFERIKQ